MTEPSSPEPERSLADRMMSHLDIDVGEEKCLREIIRKAIGRLLDAPTAHEIAADFLAEGIPTTIQFGKSVDAAVSSGYTLLLQPRGYTCWNSDRLVVTLSAAYLRADEDYRMTDIPMVLGHELPGRGIW